MSEEWMNRVEKKIDGLGRRMDGLGSVMDALGSRMDQLDSRMGGLDRRIEGLDARIDSMDGRMDRLEVRIDGVEARLSQRIDAVETGLGQRIDHVEVRLGKLEHGQQKLGVEVDENTSNIRALAEGFAGLNERMDRGFAEVLTRLDDRTTPLEAASRYFATKPGDRESRPPKRPRRKRH